MSDLLCAKCCRDLYPGRGDLYRVTIEAVADPFPPEIDMADSRQEAGERMRAILEQLNETSEREAMDQIHRRVVLYFCSNCYRKWIENPAQDE